MPFSKETILEAIRKLTKENGAVPGRLALETESGIRESDWRGVYWAKYSDAVKEAGLEPNKATTAYSQDHLLEKLAKLTRELGHVPTYSEIRLKGRSETGIPTVFHRLGSKPQIIALLLKFCEGKAAFNDVKIICESAPSSGLKHEVNDARPEGEDGIVYLLKSGKRYKFGFTNDHERRIRELAHQTAEPIRTLHTIRTDDPSGIEAYWKKRFADKCVHNEWFELTAKDVAAFKRRKKFM